jgi:exopolysaccharide biosynthesis WecB/TagA/CpsF family protein
MGDLEFDLLTGLQGSGGSAVLTDPLVRALPKVDLFGNVFICCNCEDAAKWIAGAIVQPRPTPLLLTHVNLHNLRSLSQVRGLCNTLQLRSLFLLEGIGLKAACLLTRGWAPADTNGTDLVPALLDQLRTMPCRLFLLGGRASVAALAIQKIQARWPYVEIVGCRDGYFSNDEISAIRDEVFRARPTLLLIGLGAPRQDEVALEFLQAPDLRVVWSVGGLFDRLSGRIPRAPPFMQMLRLEWLFRIFVEPRRLASRYFFDGLWLIKSCAHEWYRRLKRN